MDDANPVLDDANPVSDGANPVSDDANLVSDDANLVSDGANLVSDGANLVSHGANPVSDGANSVSHDANPVLHAANLVSEGHKRVSETKKGWFRPVFCQKSLISMKTAKCDRRTRSAQRILGLPSATLRSAFSLIEVMVVVALMALIVLALMAVFTSTQRAFRAAVTQTDVLEGSRAAMDLIATDLRGLTPSGYASNLIYSAGGAVNFQVRANLGYTPLTQNLPGSSAQRTNLLNYFFALSRNNTTWTGIGYIVDTTSASPLYPLYRFYEQTNVAFSPWLLWNDFQNASLTNMSHLVDGVVHLTLRAYDVNGTWINNYYQTYTNALNTEFLSASTTPPAGNGYGEAQILMFSNAVPAAVELELGVLEDRALARAESLPHNSTAQLNYLAQQAGAVHLFRQRVTIPNVDTTAYP